MKLYAIALATYCTALNPTTQRRRRPQSHERLMLMVASGFVLGEGVWSICGLALKAVGAPTFGS